MQLTTRLNVSGPMTLVGSGSVPEIKRLSRLYCSVMSKLPFWEKAIAHTLVRVIVSFALSAGLSAM